MSSRYGYLLRSRLALSWGLLCLLVTLGGAGAAQAMRPQQELPLEGPLDPASPAPVAPIQPVQPTALPTIEEVNATIDEIKKDATIDEERRTQLVDRFTRALQSLTKAAEARGQLEQMQNSTKTAAKRLSSLRTQLEQPLQIKADVNPWSSLEAIKDEQDRLEAELRQRQQELEGVASEARTRKESTPRLPERIATLQNRIQTLSGEPAPAENLPPRVQQAVRLEREAGIAQARAELAAAREMQLRNEAEGELLPAQQELLQRQVDATEAELMRVAQLVAKQRTEQIRATIAQYEQLFRQASPTYREDAANSPELIHTWEDIVTRAAQTEADAIQLQSDWTSLKQDYEKIDGLVTSDLATGRGLSRSVGYLLQRKLSKLPLTSVLNRTRDKLADAVDAAQSMSTQIEARREDLADGTSAEVASQADLAALEAERQLLKQMTKDIDDYMADLVTMGVTHDEYAATVANYKQLINKHLLWVRSAAPYRLADLNSLDEAGKWLAGANHLKSLGQTLLMLPIQYPLRSISWAVVMGLLIYIRGGIKRRLLTLGTSASHRLASAMKPTFQSILWTLLLALPLPMFLAGPGWLLFTVPAADSYIRSVGFALLVTAAVVLPLEVLRQVVRQGGLATDHFQWPQSATRPLRVTLWWMIHTVVPIIFLWRILEGADDVKVDLLSLSRLLFTAAMLIVAVLLWYLMHPRRGAAAAYLTYHTSGWISQLWWLWRPLIVAVPVILGLLCLAGYSYSATQLVFRLYRTIWIVTVATILGGLSVRWLLISRRRIAIQQMRQRAADRAAAAEQGAGAEVIDSDTVNVSDISAQTQRLITAVLFVFVLLGLYSAWGPVLPALSFLDSVELWPMTADDGTVLEMITLSNLVIAIPIIVLTVITVRNAPGLLETVILQRLPLENAVRYAITTLSSYLLATLGIVATARILGIHWGSVQWLVAGLGVGLGFGLQEIFANFISGIILLFEQPIRVGDLVTLDGQSGNVTKIRMRATTITNWDRQEMIVPNKTLITGTLINWSLSDSVSRIVVKVGVAYGSDTEKTCRILREIVDRHAVAAPGLQHMVTFEEFGESTLNFSIRCYVPSIEIRLQTIHELHMEIDRRFREQGIEIAFPQRDLHIRNLPEQWQRPRTAPEDSADRDGEERNRADQDATGENRAASASRTAS